MRPRPYSLAGSKQAAKLCLKNGNHFLPRPQQNSLEQWFSASAGLSELPGEFSKILTPGHTPANSDSQEWDTIPQFSKAPQQFQGVAKVENHWSDDPRQLECLYVCMCVCRGGPHSLARTPRESGIPFPCSHAVLHGPCLQPFLPLPPALKPPEGVPQKTGVGLFEGLVLVDSLKHKDQNVSFGSWVSSHN